MKKRSGLVFVLLAITAVAIITVVLLRNYFMYYSAEEVMIDWGELFSQTPGSRWGYHYRLCDLFRGR